MELLRYFTWVSKSGRKSISATSGGVLPLRVGGRADSSEGCSKAGVERLVCALGRLTSVLPCLLALPSPSVEELASPFVELPPGNCDCQALAPWSCVCLGSEIGRRPTGLELEDLDRSTGSSGARLQNRQTKHLRGLANDGLPLASAEPSRAEQLLQTSRFWLWWCRRLLLLTDQFCSKTSSFGAYLRAIGLASWWTVAQPVRRHSTTT